MVYEHVLTLFFRFINSGIIAAIGFYIIKNYIYPSLIQGYQQEKQKHADSEHALILASKQQEEEKRMFQEDQARYELLKRKIEMWHHLCTMVEQKARKAQEEQQERLYKQAQEQMKTVAHAQLIKQAGPQIIERLRLELLNTTSDSQKAHAVIEHIIRAINKVDHGAHQ